MNDVPPKLFDAKQVHMHRDQAAKTWGDYAFLKTRESSQLIERLEDVSRYFERALDFGAHDGMAAALLAGHEQVGAVEASEPSRSMRELIKARGIAVREAGDEMLGLPAAYYDLITSILSLHWANDLPGTLIQLRRAMKPDGLFIACLFGAGSLTELRTALIEAETELTGGAAPRLSPLPGLQDMAGLMQRAGFALPVVDLETVTVRYSDPFKLLRDLKGMGEQAAFAANDQPSRKPLSPRILSRMAEIYAERFSDADGRLRATFNVIWLSGWAPDASQPKPLRPGSAKHSLAEAVRKAGETSGD